MSLPIISSSMVRFSSNARSTSKGRREKKKKKEKRKKETVLTACNTASASSVLLRQKIVKKCRDDIHHFLTEENGQLAIYDAVNPLIAGRKSLAKEFAKFNIEVFSFPEGILKAPVTDNMADTVH